MCTNGFIGIVCQSFLVSQVRIVVRNMWVYKLVSFGNELCYISSSLNDLITETLDLIS